VRLRAWVVVSADEHILAVVCMRAMTCDTTSQQRRVRCAWGLLLAAEGEEGRLCDAVLSRGRALRAARAAGGPADTSASGELREAAAAALGPCHAVTHQAGLLHTGARVTLQGRDGCALAGPSVQDVWRGPGEVHEAVHVRHVRLMPAEHLLACPTRARRAACAQRVRRRAP
jgi:hypothetical protein